MIRRVLAVCRRLACIAALVAGAALAPPAATAVASAPGTYLSWKDCPLADSSTASLVGACAESAEEELLVSFELSSPADSVIGLEAVIDLQTSSSSLPPWWGYAPGGCRFGKLTASAFSVGRDACTDFWLGDATFDATPVYSQGAPRGGPNQARIVVAIAVLSSQLRSLAAGVHYYGARLRFVNDPVLACAGCDVPACLVLNSIRLVNYQNITCAVDRFK